MMAAPFDSQYPSRLLHGSVAIWFRRAAVAPLLTLVSALLCLIATVAMGGELNDAVKAGDLPRIEVLIASGANVNERDFVGTPLHTAAALGSVKIAKLLIDAGADLEGIGIGQSHPLHAAARNNRAVVAAYLIQRGAQVDSRDGQGLTPLLVAAADGNAEVVEALLDGGADPRAEDNRGGRDAVIEVAVFYGHIAVVKLLLSRGIDINAPNDRDGETPLFAATMAAFDRGAAMTQRLKMIEFLIGNGADPNIADTAGKTAYQLATEPDIREALLKLGATP
jgi:ankyrin repeat protein